MSAQPEQTNTFGNREPVLTEGGAYTESSNVDSSRNDNLSRQPPPQHPDLQQHEGGRDEDNRKGNIFSDTQQPNTTEQTQSTPQYSDQHKTDDRRDESNRDRNVVGGPQQSNTTERIQPTPQYSDQRENDDRRDESNRDRNVVGGPQQPDTTTQTQKPQVQDTVPSHSAGVQPQAGHGTHRVDDERRTDPYAHPEVQQGPAGTADVGATVPESRHAGTQHDSAHPHQQQHQGVPGRYADPYAKDASRTDATAARVPGLADNGHTATPIAGVGPAGAGLLPQSTTGTPGTQHSSGGTGLRLAGKLEQAAGTLLSSQTLKDKGQEKELRADTLKNVHEAERLEAAAKARRGNASGQEAHRAQGQVGGSNRV